MIEKIKGNVSPTGVADKINEAIESINSGGTGGSDLEKATQAEAESGVNDTKYMTPFLTKKSIEHNGGGGGGGSGGRIKLIGTEAEPISLDELTEPESYVISGVLEGLPTEFEDMLSESGSPDLVLQFDVLIEMTLEYEEDEEIFVDTVFTQELQVFDFTTGYPAFYQRMAITTGEGTFYMDWKKTSFEQTTDCILAYAGNGQDLLIEIDPNTYRIAFAGVPEGAIIEDVLFTEHYIDYPEQIYPALKVTELDGHMRAEGSGEFFKFTDYNFGAYIAGTIHFNDSAEADSRLAYIQNSIAYVLYKTKFQLVLD